MARRHTRIDKNCARVLFSYSFNRDLSPRVSLSLSLSLTHSHTLIDRTMMNDDEIRFFFFFFSSLDAAAVRAPQSKLVTFI